VKLDEETSKHASFDTTLLQTEADERKGNAMNLLEKSVINHERASLVVPHVG